MGLLDDAIRQHLDLKRRRGADPDEVERAEREALGPVRRVGATDTADDEVPEDHEVQGDLAAEDVLDDEPQPLGGVAFDHEADEQSWSFEDDAPEPAAHVNAADTERESGPEPPSREPDPLGQETAVHRPDFLDEDAFDEPDLEPGGRETPPPHPAGGQTAEYNVEEALDHRPAEEGEEGEGLLEETPEFLQDTPDHDRLWFEQRPPKDFDFDG
jgi:hypothetical protein